MTTLAPPLTPEPQPPPTASSPSESTLSSSPFYGRSAAEYIASFALDFAAFRDRVILDVAAGPSSFAIESARRGLEVAAIDPLYGCTLATLATHVQLDYARVGVEACRRLRGARLACQEALEQDRRAAAQRFLTDYESGFLRNRYIGGALPRLPFLDRSFDLVLCGHLLFGPQTPFAGPALVDACRELVRVTTGEVRIFPAPAVSSRGAKAALATLASLGIASQRVTIHNALDGNFPARVLILRRSIREA